jgi:hypothetical protein
MLKMLLNTTQRSTTLAARKGWRVEDDNAERARNRGKRERVKKWLLIIAR